MNYKLRDSKKAHEQHVSTGVTAAMATVETKRARDVNSEEGPKLRPRQVPSDMKGSAGYTCPSCDRSFTTKAGLSLHVTRWCRVRSGGADAPPSLVIPGQGRAFLAARGPDKTVQHHKSFVMDYALTHGERKWRGETNGIETKLRIDLPNAKSVKKWRELDELISTKVATQVSSAELEAGNITEVFNRFTSIV